MVKPITLLFIGLDNVLNWPHLSPYTRIEKYVFICINMCVNFIEAYNTPTFLYSKECLHGDSDQHVLKIQNCRSCMEVE